MSTPFTYRDLEVWKLGIDLVETCYKATGAFPKSELYGLTGQLRRASVSIPGNVAEGQARKSTKAYRNHVSIAIGSHAELTTCIEVATRLGFMSRAERDPITVLSNSVGRLLNGLHPALKRKLSARQGDRSVTPNPNP